jgi:hypothetical protein
MTTNSILPLMHPGLGGLDVFVSKINTDTTYEKGKKY